MKGVSNIILFIVLMLVLTIVAISLSGKAKTMYEEKSTEIGEIFHPMKAYYFDIESLVKGGLNSGEFDNYFKGESSQFCNELKEGIKYYLQNEQPYEIGLVKFKHNAGSSAMNNIWHSLLGISGFGCKDEPITEEIQGAKRLVCNFNKVNIGYHHLYENDNLLKDYQPDFHLCNVPDEFENEIKAHDNIAGHGYIGLHLIKDPLTDDFPSEFPKGGQLRIFVTNATVNSTLDCNFNLFVCAQPAIAISEDNATMKIFSFFRDFDLNERRYGYDWSDNCDNLNYPHYFEFDLDGYYSKETIARAIDAGLREWNKLHIDDSSQIRAFWEGITELNGVSVSGPHTRVKKQGPLRIHFDYGPFELKSNTKITFACDCPDFKDHPDSDCRDYGNKKNSMWDYKKSQIVYNNVPCQGKMRVRIFIEGKWPIIDNTIVMYPHIVLCCE